MFWNHQLFECMCVVHNERQLNCSFFFSLNIEISASLVMSWEDGLRVLEHLSSMECIYKRVRAFIC